MNISLPLELIHLVTWLLFIAVFVLFAVYAERKVSAFIQNRLGPMETGPAGLFQTFADILKLLTKESIIPAAADKWLFLAAPLLIFISVFAGYAVIPVGGEPVGWGMDVGVLLIIGVVSIHVIGILMAGWGSNNKYALLGSLRSVSQILSYEIPAGLALLCGVMMMGSLNLNELSALQGIYSEEKLLAFGVWDVTDIGGITAWAVFRYPHLLLAYLIYFSASLAECNRAPFDLPEAESELISGFHVEYSGFRFAIIFLAEYANMFLVGLIAGVVFLGGWNTILPNINIVDISLPLAEWTSGQPGTMSGILWGAFWILSKGFFGVFVQMWLRWTLPRFRADQLMKLSWKVLAPAGFLLFVVSGGLKLLEVYNELGI